MGGRGRAQLYKAEWTIKKKRGVCGQATFKLAPPLFIARRDPCSIGKFKIKIYKTFETGKNYANCIMLKKQNVLFSRNLSLYNYSDIIILLYYLF